MTESDCSRLGAALANHGGLGRDRVMLWAILLEQSTKNGQEAVSAAYSSFERQFGWGPSKRQEAYVQDMLADLEGRGLLRRVGSSFALGAEATVPAHARLAVEPPMGLAEWCISVTAEAFSIYLLAKHLLSSADVPWRFDAASLDTSFGKWCERPCTKYLRRTLDALRSSGLIQGSWDSKPYAITHVAALPALPAGVLPDHYHPTSGRQTLSASLRRRIHRRDNGLCGYCGDVCDQDYQVDHIIPVYMGGAETDERNLVTACQRCNVGRNDFKGTDRSEANMLWRNHLPEWFGGRNVVCVREATVNEGGNSRRIPIIDTE